MDSTERHVGTRPEVDLSPFAEMLGVKRALQAVIDQGGELGKEVVLEILREQHDQYPENNKFAPKAERLRRLTVLFEAGDYTIDELLKATGVNLTSTPERRDGIIRRFLARH